ncbi:MAG: hypothetical protein IPP69_09155 [Flavobacteriales bacterium]|nr:hypothetical protein [Flavobacteriales bacterium]
MENIRPLRMDLLLWYFYFIVGSTRGMICFTRLKYDAQGEHTEEDDNEAL